MEISVKLDVIDRDIINGYTNEEYAALRSRDREGSLLMARYRFSVDGDHFPVQVLLDAGEMSDEDIVPTAKRRIHDILTAALAHVADWKG